MSTEGCGSSRLGVLSAAMSDDLQLGGAPPLGPGPSLEDEEKAMKSGKGGLIAILGGIVVLAVGGLAFMMSGGDAEAYETLGQNVNGAKRELFDGFWGCVFQGDTDPANNTELASELHQRAARGSERFAEYVRRSCLPKLTELETRLRALIPPEDMVQSVNELIAATETMKGGWSDYVAYVEALEGPYDETTAADKVSTIARGWFEFKSTIGAINRAVREKIS